MTSAMIRAWLATTTDARRGFSLLIAVAGSSVAAIGMAASPAPWAFEGNYAIMIGLILGAAAGTYIRHRRLGDTRAPLWALALGVSVAALLVAIFGTAVVIRPTVLGIFGPGDASYGLRIVGFLVMFVGALLWERDARRHRFAAGGHRVGPPVRGIGDGVLIVAFALSRSSSHQDPARLIAGADSPIAGT